MSSTANSSNCDVREEMKDFYGKQLKSSSDFNTSACSKPARKLQKHVRDAMKLVHDEVAKKYYGCGIVVPERLEGMNILDLGCGSGHDCFILGKLVGENGRVTGIDMTDEQLNVANKYVDYHRDLFGYKSSNVKFVNGYIEDLKSAGIQDSSIDIIISNCVINLCKDKKAVLHEAFRVLKDGGELYFSDMYADRPPSQEIKSHKELWGEGIGGALYWKELYSFAKEIGFEMPRTVDAKTIAVTKPEFKEISKDACGQLGVAEPLKSQGMVIVFSGDSRFIAVGYRLFKLPAGMKREAAELTYKGGITGFEDELQFDHFIKFIKDQPVAVDGDVVAIVQSSRIKDAFKMEELKPGATPISNKEIDPFTLDSSVGDAGCNTRSCSGSK